jgi:hypothetical protein
MADGGSKLIGSSDIKGREWVHSGILICNNLLCMTYILRNGYMPSVNLYIQASLIGTAANCFSHEKT